jgi:hypothetical protein
MRHYRKKSKTNRIPSSPTSHPARSPRPPPSPVRPRTVAPTGGRAPFLSGGRVPFLSPAAARHASLRRPARRLSSRPPRSVPPAIEAPTVLHLKGLAAPLHSLLLARPAEACSARSCCMTRPGFTWCCSSRDCRPNSSTSDSSDSTCQAAALSL